MEALEAILSRRSIRRFRADDIDDEHIHQMLAAGFAAPSAHNERPWHFIIIRERETLRELVRVHPYAGMLSHAPLAILVCADLALRKDDTVDYWVQDCAAATENILLAAHGMGLGACWLGMYPRENRVAILKTLLDLPESVIPFCAIAVGKPAETKPPSQRESSDRLHYEKW